MRISDWSSDVCSSDLGSACRTFIQARKTPLNCFAIPLLAHHNQVRRRIARAEQSVRRSLGELAEVRPTLLDEGVAPLHGLVRVVVESQRGGRERLDAAEFLRGHVERLLCQLDRVLAEPNALAGPGDRFLLELVESRTAQWWEKVFHTLF